MEVDTAAWCAREGGEKVLWCSHGGVKGSLPQGLRITGVSQHLRGSQL